MGVDDIPIVSAVSRPTRTRTRTRPRSRRHRGFPANRSVSFDVEATRRLIRRHRIGDGYGNEATAKLRQRHGGAVGGTSLVELLVVLALLSVMLLVAAQLVVHSMQLLDATARAVRNPLVVHVSSRRRRDVQEAAAVQTEEWSWTDDPLVLIQHDGSRVRFELAGENLVREKTGGLGEVFDKRVILRGVTSWWWRCPVEGVVDLNITYLVNPEPERHVSRDPGYGLKRRKENLRFTLRGGGGGTQW